MYTYVGNLEFQENRERKGSRVYCWTFGKIKGRARFFITCDSLLCGRIHTVAPSSVRYFASDKTHLTTKNCIECFKGFGYSRIMSLKGVPKDTLKIILSKVIPDIS